MAAGPVFPVSPPKSMFSRGPVAVRNWAVAGCVTQVRAAGPAPPLIPDPIVVDAGGLTAFVKAAVAGGERSVMNEAEGGQGGGTPFV